MSEYSTKPKSFGGRGKVELDLSNYARKADLKNATNVNALAFAKKTDLANLKFDVDNIDIDQLKNVLSGLNSIKTKVDISNIGQLKTIQVDLIKLIDVVKTEVDKKTEYNAKIKDIEDKILDITSLASNTNLNA